DVTNASDIDAVGIVLGARGINAIAYGDANVTNTGGIYAGSLYGDAFGIYAYGQTGSANVDNGGDIAAISYYGMASGILASGVDAAVTNSGAIEVYGYTGAKGIYAASDNATTVTNTGDISVETGLFVQAVDYYGYSLGYVNGGTAIGIQATGGEAGTSVDNSGAIAVNAGYATGIEAQSYGDTTVTNSGNIVAGSGLGSYYDNGTGYTYYYGTQVATGINAGSNGAGAAVTVTSSGDIAADGIFGATGIAATATGEGGTATITSSGNVYASVNQKYGYGAYGLVASADADATVTNDGGLIDVYSAGAATGAAALSFAG